MINQILLVSVFIFFSLCKTIYAAENKEDIRHHPPPEEYRTSSQDTRASKPILPPAVPSGSFGISPTPSPHISSPDVTSTTISLPSYTTPGFPQVHIPTLPSAPVHIPTPTVPIHTEISQVPIIGNAIGEVLNKGTDKKGVLWLEVRGQLFNQTVKIKVRNLKNTPIVKQDAIMRFEDIKIGDSVNVIFSTEGQDNIASFISILTEEELKMMQGEGAGQIAASEEPDKSDNSTASE